MQWLIIWHILNYYVTSLYSEDKFILNSIIIENKNTENIWSMTETK